MQERKDFFSPRLTGKRYENHTLPLDVLEDMSSYEELLKEVAKWLYLQDNPGKKRVPKGFNEGLSLHLSGIVEGSSIPKITLVAAMDGLFENEVRYFEKARDIISQAVAGAGSHMPVNTPIPDHLLKKFNRIGKNLKEDEGIEFCPDNPDKAVLNKEVRKRLILASGERYIQNPVSLRAAVKEFNKEKKSCMLAFGDAGSLDIPSIPDQFYNVLLNAFNNFEEKQKILIKGVGRYNKADVLEALESVESILPLEQLDVISRLDELAQLENGWFNGEGKAYSKTDLSIFANFFEEEFDTSLPLPYIYPKTDGGLQIEWNLKRHAISLEVTLPDLKTGYFHYNKMKDIVTEDILDLTLSASWRWLNEKLLNIFTGPADER